MVSRQMIKLKNLLIRHGIYLVTQIPCLLPKGHLVVQFLMDLILILKTILILVMLPWLMN